MRSFAARSSSVKESRVTPPPSDLPIPASSERRDQRRSAFISLAELRRGTLCALGTNGVGFRALEGTSGLEDRGLVTLLADEHHADGQTFGEGAGDGHGQETRIRGRRLHHTVLLYAPAERSAHSDT